MWRRRRTAGPPPPSPAAPQITYDINHHASTHGVEPGQVGRRDVAEVDGQAGDVRGVERAEDAVGEQPAVQTRDVVPGGRQDRGHHGAQVALVAGQQYAHWCLLVAVPPVHPMTRPRHAEH
jgi:hypothetical protein